MTNITIKANVHNLTLSDVFYILQKYQESAVVHESHLVKFKGHEYKLEVIVNESINYTITELK